MSPKVDEAHASARREQILMAAMNCFARKGFHKTTVKDICGEAQLSPGAVYSYFKSKDEIIEALAQWGEEMNSNLFDFADAQHPPNAKAAFSEGVNLFIGQFKDPMCQTGPRMDAMFLAEALSNEQLTRIGKRSYNKILDRIRRMVTDAQESGEADPGLDATGMAQVLFSIVQGLGTQILFNAGEEVDIDAYQKAAVALITGTFFNSADKED